MHTNDHGRADARSRATRRLRHLTIGTTLLGVAGTGLLSGLAGLTYDGTPSTTSTVAAITSSITTDDGATSTAAPSVSATPLVTVAQGAAHVSTGGS